MRGNEFSYRLQVIGRLRDGVSIEQAQAQMTQITAGLAAETPRWFEDRVATVEPLRDYLTRGVRTWMLMLLAAVGFVLLIACVNLANLMLARASARRRELVIRAALGASRWDLVRAMLVESLMLSLGGAALGAFIAWLGVEVLRSAIPADVPRTANIAVDLRVLAATTIAAIASGLMFGLAPILEFSRPLAGPGVSQVMRTNTANPTQQWLRGALVTVEVALAVVLLVGSGLFLASFARVTSVNLGIDPHDVLTVRVRPLVGEKNWALAQQRNRGLLQNILERVRTIPGVDVAAMVSGGVPLRGDLRTIDFGIPGRALPRGEDLDFNEISPDYFRAIRVPLLKGRFFADDDRSGSEPVVIINDAAARKYFPGEDPVGKIVQFLGTRRIVGIVGNIRHDGPETDWRRQGFVPLEQSQAVGATLVLRLSRDVGSVLPAVKSAVWSQFPGLALPDIQTLSQYREPAHRPAALQHDDAEPLWPARYRHCLRRHLRRHGVCRAVAYAGDRDSDGTWRRACRHPVVGIAASRGVSRLRARDRDDGRLGAGRSGSWISVSDRAARSVGLRRRRGYAGGDGRDRRIRPGMARRAR